MSPSLLRVVLLAAVLLATGCDAPRAGADATPTPVGSNSAPRSATRDPARLPTVDEERTIVAALASAGVRGTTVLPSKFDWLFGAAAPRSGTFEGAIDGTQVWADVHFLDTPVPGVTACSGSSASGETAVTVSISGRPQVLGGGSATGYLAGPGPMYFAASERIFVMTPDVRVQGGLRSSLGLAVPSCVWREPATLPVLGWEHEVVDAFGGAGLEVRLVGGSKWESFLGATHEARFFSFGGARSTGAADVIRLGEPLRELRMCSAPSSPGFTKWTMVEGGTARVAAEGSQQLYPLVGPRFFVLAWDPDAAAALSRGLGLAAPPC